MNCKKCGSPLEPNEKFCTNCGEKVEELLNNQTVGSQVSGTPVSQPILPDAPEAPLPGTVNKVTEPQAQSAPQPNDAQSPVNPVPVAPVAPQVQPAPQPVVAPVSPVNPAPVAQASNAVQPTESKKSNIFIIIIIVVLAISAGVLLFVLLYGTNGLKNKEKTTTTTTTTTETTTTKKTTTTASIINEQEINGVLVTIPNGWDYTKSEVVGIIHNASRGTQINIYPVNQNNFEYYKQNINSLESTLTQIGVQIVDRNIGSDGQREYIMFNIIYKGRKEIMMFTSMPMEML